MGGNGTSENSQNVFAGIRMQDVDPPAPRTDILYRLKPANLIPVVMGGYYLHENFGKSIIIVQYQSCRRDSRMEGSGTSRTGVIYKHGDRTS